MGCVCLLAVYNCLSLRVWWDISTLTLFFHFDFFILIFLMVFATQWANAEKPDLQICDFIKTVFQYLLLKLWATLSWLLTQSPMGVSHEFKTFTCSCDLVMVPRATFVYSFGIALINYITYVMVQEKSTFFLLLIPIVIHKGIPIYMKADSYLQILRS